MNSIPSFLPEAAQFRAVNLSDGDRSEGAIDGLRGVNAIIGYMERLNTKGLSRPVRVMADRLENKALDMRNRLNNVITGGKKPFANGTDRRYLDSVTRRYRNLLLATAEWCKANNDPEAARHLRQLAHKSG